jgi:hypothetical protein
VARGPAARKAFYDAIKEAELGEGPMKRKLLKACEDQKLLGLVEKKLAMNGAPAIATTTKASGDSSTSTVD